MVHYQCIRLFHKTVSYRECTMRGLGTIFESVSDVNIEKCYSSNPDRIRRDCAQSSNPDPHSRPGAFENRVATLIARRPPKPPARKLAKNRPKYVKDIIRKRRFWTF